MTSSVIVVHGGSWKNDVYEGGTKEFIPIPDCGIKYEDLLAKIEVRLKKDKSMYAFDIVALVHFACGEKMRIKITDDFEWSCLIEMTRAPTIYVDVCDRSKIDLSSISDEGDAIIDNMTVRTLRMSTGSSSSHHVVSTQQLLPTVSDEVAIVHYQTEIQSERGFNEQLVYGGTFGSKDRLTSTLGVYHLKNFLEFRVKKSDLKRYHTVCHFEGSCIFSMKAKSYGNMWRIREWSPHNCERDLRRGSAIKVSSKAIAEVFVPNTTEEGFEFRPRDIQSQMIRDFGINLKYSTALAGKNQVRKMNYGDPDKSFQILPKYLYMLEQSNPGSVVGLQTCDDHSFQYCYFSLDACIKAFRACRPVIVIDATHLKGKYKGVLFVASTKDANEQIVPLAFGVGDKENDSSWTWFLQHVRQSFGTPDNLLIVSDQHLSIKNAVQSVFPGTPHGLCTYHIQGNLRGWGDVLIDIFHDAANAYKKDDFNYHITNIMTTAPGAYEKLMSIGPSRWAKSKCPVRRYAFGTSNAVEVLNSRLKWARGLPICALLKQARNLVQSWFFERRTKARGRTDELTEYADKRLGFAIRKGSFMRVEPITDLKFKVISNFNSNIVDIGLRECSCQVFQMDLFPCSHVAKVVSYLKQTPVSYVHAYYTTRTLCGIYAGDVMPVPDPTDWRIPGDVALRVVGTPTNPRQAGRPRITRMQAAASKKGSRVCSRCHQKGHYQSSCTALLNTNNQGVEVCNSQVGAKRSRKPKSCGVCGVVGHTRKTCTDPNRF